MAHKIYLDANVILDSILTRPDKHYNDLIIQSIDNHTLSVFISPIVLHLVFYVARKFQPEPLLREFFITFLKKTLVIEAPKAVIVNALKSNIKDVEDAIQYHTALYYQLDYFISSDKKLKKSALTHLPVLTAEEFLQLPHP